MNVSRDIFFSIALVLFTAVTTWAESDEKLITPEETIFPSISLNGQSPFFSPTAPNENVGPEDARFKKLRRWYEHLGDGFGKYFCK